MLDVGLLLKPLTPAENPGIDTLDQRFQDIAARVEAGEVEKAAEETQALIGENIIDIRLIAYFLAGAFLQNGLAGLPDIFQALTDLLGPNWPAVGPVNKKEKQTESGLGWFLARVTKKIQATQEAKDETWTKWTAQFPYEAAESLKAKLEGFRNAMGGIALPSQKCADSLRVFEGWAAEYAASIAPPPADAPAPAPEPAQETPEAEAPAAGAAPAAGVPAGASSIEGSSHLEELKAKLKAFEVLVRKKDYLRAAVVLADVNDVIENFDPRVYLPRLFSTFYQLSSANVNELFPVIESNKDSIQWKAMDQLYRVDLQSFVS